MKLKKTMKIMSMVTAVVATIASVGGIPASAAYATSGSWSLHYYTYDSTLSTSIKLVAYGNDYNATITSKSGNCSLNTVTITSDWLSRSVTISELNMPTLLDATLSGSDYVIFKVALNAENGSRAYNAGTIEVRT